MQLVNASAYRFIGRYRRLKLKKILASYKDVCDLVSVCLSRSSGVRGGFAAERSAGRRRGWAPGVQQQQMRAVPRLQAP